MSILCFIGIFSRLVTHRCLDRPNFEYQVKHSNESHSYCALLLSYSSELQSVKTYD